MILRAISGGLLVGLGLALLGSQLPGPTERLLFGGALFVAYGLTGVAVLAGRARARVPGLLLAAAGAVAAALVAGLATSGEARVAAEIFFLADGPYFSWLEVFFGAAAFASASIVVGLALALGARSAGDRATV